MIWCELYRPISRNTGCNFEIELAGCEENLLFNVIYRIITQYYLFL